MFNFRRFFYEPVAQSEPDASSESEDLCLPRDIEKTGPLLRQQAASKKPRQITVVVKILFFAFIVASAILFGKPIADFAARTYNVVTNCGRPHGQTPVVDQAPGVNISKSVAAATRPWNDSRIANRKNWKASCSSPEKNLGCDQAIDDKGEATDWKSAAKPLSTHWISLDLQEDLVIHALEVAPSRQGHGGAVRKHTVEVRGTTGDWQVVARGAWRDVSNNRERRLSKSSKLVPYSPDSANNMGGSCHL